MGKGYVPSWKKANTRPTGGGINQNYKIPKRSTRGFMSPQMSPCILCKKNGDSYATLAKEGWVINFPYKHGVHKYPLGMVNWWFSKECSNELSMIFLNILAQGWPNLSCQSYKVLGSLSFGLNLSFGLDFVVFFITECDSTLETVV